MGVFFANIQNIEDALLSNSREDIIKTIEAKIIQYTKKYNYFQLTLSFYGIKCSQFIISENIFNENNKNIQFSLEDIKLKMIKSINYLEIKEYISLSRDLSENFTEVYEFRLPKIIKNLNSIDSQKNIAVILKAKEKDFITSYSYNFYNISNKAITINSLNKFPIDFENQKCYLFNGFDYFNNKLTPTNISSIEIIDENSNIEDIIFPKNVNNCKNGDIINLKGNIKDLKIEKFLIEIEELETKNLIKLKLNLDLIKKINPNSLCEFIRLKKLNNNLYTFTNLSEVYSNSDTYVELKFNDFYEKEKYYNRIKINDTYINIDNETIIFKIDANNKDSIFEQKFIYEKYNDNKDNPINFSIESTYEFYLEINKGRKNSFSSFLNKKGGYTYQIYFQSKDENNLPTDIKIKKNEKDFITLSNFENFNNSLKKRITIINTIKQDFIKFDYKKRQFRLNELEFVDFGKYANLKLYYLIKTKKQNKTFIDYTIAEEGQDEIFVFELLGENKKKANFIVEDKDRNNINTLFDLVYKTINNEKNREPLNLSTINKIKQLTKGALADNLKEGLKEFVFIDSKNVYDIIKKFTFIYMYALNYKNSTILNLYNNSFKKIINIIQDSDYLSRIKVLIYYFNYIGDSFYPATIIDIYDRENKDFYNELCFNSFNLFFQILDNQTEKSAFYQGIHQFNGKIREDLIKSISLYSGVIMNVNEIKFELVKNINRFCFINFREKYEAEAEFSLSSKIITFYPLSIDKSSEIIVNSNATPTIFLFLIFHEVCGHLKTNLNNITNSPPYHIDENLNLIFTEFNNNDSGFIFESMLIGNAINSENLLANKNSNELFNMQLYIKDNFNDLKKKVNEFNPKITYSKPIRKYLDKKKPKDINEKKEIIYKEKIHKLPESFMEKLKEVEKDLENYNYHSLYPLFKIPNDMSPEEFKELLKDNPVYKKFMKVLPDEYKKY